MRGAQGRSGRAGVGALMVVVGMVREARIVRGGAPTVVVGGGRSEGLADKLEAALGRSTSGVLSFGLCGGLDPTLKPGDLLVATAVMTDGQAFLADLVWADNLAAALPGARRVLIAGVDTFVVDAAAKRTLAAATCAAAVDTESHIAAAFARRHGLSFAALRAVSDGAARALPKAAQVGLGPDGRADLAAVLARLAAEPWQIPALIRTALEAEAGLRALKRAWGLLS